MHGACAQVRQSQRERLIADAALLGSVQLHPNPDDCPLLRQKSQPIHKAPWCRLCNPVYDYRFKLALVRAVASEKNRVLNFPRNSALLPLSRWSCGTLSPSASSDDR